ncbi:DedA family protein [Saccharothrix syringae]|uniref:DedA family protein n=1 Tax=Saccharothrix syringae TaxID=103733 RepID=A0A5Q0GSQ4_SACSY|nr:DedA family protein [Saccharothrix syringae]QFZ17087.1 DedA family protein [Saccharothrix syringae]
MDVVSWVTDLMDKFGAPGAGLAIALENLFPPLPSELFLPLAGFTAGQGRMNLVAAILWTTAGSVVGALLLYYLGAALGRDRLRRVVERMPLMKVSDVDRAEQWFARHGRGTVFFGRMVPVFRSLISIPAGVERMPVPQFTLLTAAGSLIWNTALILAGYFLGANYHLVEQYLGIVSKVVLGLLAAAVVWFVVSRVNRRRGSQARR